jgi:hypothetical protein
MVGSGLHQGLSGPGLVELHTAAQAEGPAQPSLGVQRGHTLKPTPCSSGFSPKNAKVKRTFKHFRSIYFAFHFLNG